MIVTAGLGLHIVLRWRLSCFSNLNTCSESEFLYKPEDSSYKQYRKNLIIMDDYALMKQVLQCILSPLICIGVYYLTLFLELYFHCNGIVLNIQSYKCV